jgi:hypothetical protein
MGPPGHWAPARGAAVRACGKALVESATVLVMTTQLVTARLMTVLVTAVRADRGRAVAALGSSDSPYARRGAWLVSGRAA